MRILSINHGPSVPGGVFDEVAEEARHELERWVVPLGGTPQPPSSYDAVMVFGGSMHPVEDERYDWLATEERFLHEALEREVPIVGVCLGAQMLARAAGAWVGPASEPEIGWVDVELTPAGRADPLLGVLPAHVDAFQWHSYSFAVPGGGAELARNAVCSQAFRAGRRAWGVQFHAEVTLEMIERWIAEEPDELPIDVAEFTAQARARIDAWNAHGRRLASAFLDSAAG